MKGDTACSMIDDRCSLYGVGLFKSTLYVYVSDFEKGKRRRHGESFCNYNTASEAEGGYMINDPIQDVCKLCGSDRERRERHQILGITNNNQVQAQFKPEVAKYGARSQDGANCVIFSPMRNNSAMWSQDLFDTNNNNARSFFNDMVLGSVKEGIRLCTNVRRGTENVDSVVTYKDNRRYKNQVLVSPGLCPCPSAFSETNFMHLTNTHKRFKNRLLLHNRLFKTKQHSESVCIQSKSVHKSYKTTLTHDLDPSPIAWHETKLDFVPRKFRSVYHIGFSNNKDSDKDNHIPNNSQKFSFEKWKFAEINNAFSKIACLHSNKKPLKSTDKQKGGEHCGSNEIGLIGMESATEPSNNQSNANEVVITNVFKGSTCETPRHRYFTVEQK